MLNTSCRDSGDPFFFTMFPYISLAVVVHTVSACCGSAYQCCGSALLAQGRQATSTGGRAPAVHHTLGCRGTDLLQEFKQGIWLCYIAAGAVGVLPAFFGCRAADGRWRVSEHRDPGRATYPGSIRVLCCLCRCCNSWGCWPCLPQVVCFLALNKTREML